MIRLRFKLSIAEQDPHRVVSQLPVLYVGIPSTALQDEAVLLQHALGGGVVRKDLGGKVAIEDMSVSTGKRFFVDSTNSSASGWACCQ